MSWPRSTKLNSRPPIQFWLSTYIQEREVPSTVLYIINNKHVLYTSNHVCDSNLQNTQTKTYLVYLTIGSIADNLYQFKNTSRVLEREGPQWNKWIMYSYMYIYLHVTSICTSTTVGWMRHISCTCTHIYITRTWMNALTWATNNIISYI